MHQITYLRMRCAAELLASTQKTIEAIAEEVGYHNPFVFSNAFTKWIGWRPSLYRRKKVAGLGEDLIARSIVGGNGSTWKTHLNQRKGAKI